MSLTETETTELRLSSGNGPVTRTILATPIREARPEEVPIINISDIFSPSQAARKAVALEIRAAATNNGFFYISDHGVPSAVTSPAYEASLSFFCQQPAQKEPANVSHSIYKFGWKPPATQRVNPFEGIDRRESFSWRYDPRYDPSVPNVSAIPPHISRFIQHDSDNFPWSAATPHLKQTVIPLFQSVLGLGRALLRSFALSLDLDENALDDKFTHPDVGMALNYYPPLPPADGKSVKDVSIGSHTDFQLFTILIQDSVGGLQVLSRSGQWLYAKPIPGTFVVNFGDYMQRITNDRYPSTVHRVQNFSGQERLSMAFFFGFNLNESCAVLDSCVGEGEAKKYEPVACHEWTARRVKAMHDTSGKEARSSS
ncbi:hypothetical protein B0H66DRAFT_384058 [Apodospora peruviana]|uniref:Fe2OG dioxygenase domain-containing protein n=1 Tax=Apodospora peruviana TaxID=516989 RepID=A0AAE0HUA0_9PEZI|nr:hypothetical protein B0H66DRAFT_384058 [Apodospora peruviana]